MGKVREALFSMLEARGVDWSSARVLDLFAGSGSLGFEALSRGAEHVAFVEMAPYAAKVIQDNAALLAVEASRFSLWREDARKLLGKRPERPFSVVFIDPPYALDALGHTLAALMKHGWVTPGGIINAEVEAHAPLSSGAVPAALEPLADRSYGQTRVMLWSVRQDTRGCF
jgi:16S rRNA (guanine966-N2)-methyltransferase